MMDRASLLLFTAGLLLEIYGLAAETTDKNAGGVFMSQQTAHNVLRRQPRANHGLEEVLHKDNLERECREELCSMEEAREVFENDEKTMEFWAGYIDGDQCNPNPCQNGGVCEDGISSFICWCKPNFSGKTCEIEVTKQCAVNNGGCSHFCVMQGTQPLCRCAEGYRLELDRRSCGPIVQFSCGLLTSSSNSATRSFVKPRSSNFTYEKNATNSTLDDDEIDILDLYDYFELATNDPELVDTPQPSTADMNTIDLKPSDNPSENVSLSNSSRKSRSVMDSQNVTEEVLSWGFPTLPTITAEKNSDQRIVGGDEATPGEVPWQVTLMSRSDPLDRAKPFCGGSLLSDSWVITAAHCIVQARIAKRKFFIRVGEHDVDVDEGPERDHEVAEEHLHPLYKFNKSQYNHDIAVLKLSNPVDLSIQRRPICLGPKDFTENLLRDSSSSLVSGWGRIKFQGIEATRLQKLQVPYVDRTTCKQSSREHITRFMFCAGYRNIQKDACQGDSGGPHVTNYKGTWFLTGIVSWGEECAKDGKYGVYTRVSRYYAWISQTTGIRMST